MNNWIRDIKVKCSINCKTAQIRAIKKSIVALQNGIAKNERKVIKYKEALLELDGNQIDLFIGE